jgi:hypothetical protein
MYIQTDDSIGALTMDIILFCDIDGTLCVIDESAPKPQTDAEWRTTFANARPRPEVISYVRKLQQSSVSKTIIFTGRWEDNRAATVKWLRNQGVQYDELMMRPNGDTRENVVIKISMLIDTLKRNPTMQPTVIDDDNDVIRACGYIGISAKDANSI